MADFQLDAELAYAAWVADEETTVQENIVIARKYFDGEHKAMLTERQKEFLYHQQPGDERFAVNYCQMIVRAVFERLLVKGFESDDDTLSEWAWDLWQANRMDEKQTNVHRGAIRDGEYFVFVDWDQENSRPDFIPHPRYTDPEADGTGFGCKAFYPDDDPSYPMERASKRFTETVKVDGRRVTRQRMTVYYPDRVEKFVMAGAGEMKEATWIPLETEGEPWPIPWTMGGVKPGEYDDNGEWIPNASAEPLGIPIIHFRNGNRRSELWDAVPLQDLINKTALDIIATADAAGFPIRVAEGWTATTNGQPPESDGSNYLKLFPGAFIGTPPDGKLSVIPAADISNLLASLDSWIVKLAQVTDTPISRFQITRQVAAEGTLKQQEAPLLGKVRYKQTLFGNGWEDCLYMARRLALYNSQDVPDGDLETLWESAETRDDKEFREAMALEMQMGVPKETLWAKLGYDQAEIAKMKAMAGEEMQQTANIGGELLRAFEGGGFGTEQPQQAQGGQRTGGTR